MRGRITQLKWLSVTFVFLALTSAQGWIATPGTRALSTIDFNYVLQDGAVSITACNGSCPSHLDVPSLIHGYPVTKIGIYAFRNERIRSVTIPNSIVEIGYFAFAQNNLTSLSLPDSVALVDNFAFAYNEINSIEFGSAANSIGAGAFAYNNLTALTLPNSIAAIGEYAFANNNLTTLSLPAYLEHIPFAAFRSNLLTRVSIPPGASRIEGYAFYGNRLTEVIIPNSVESIESLAFYDNLITSVALGNQVKYVGESAFARNQISTIALPSTLTQIDSYAFASNVLSEVVIPRSVYNIADWAFSNNQISELDLGAGVQYIGTGAFRNNRLSSLRIPGSVVDIGESAFADNVLQFVELGDSIQEIGAGAFFSDCVEGNEIGRIVIPHSVVSIGAHAFHCNRATSLELGNSVRTIGPNSFAGNQLVDLVIPNSVTAIASGAFSMNGLASVSFGSGLALIGDSAFEHNVLTRIVLPRSVLSVGQEAFANNQLSSVVMFGNAPSTFRNVFTNNPMLSNVCRSVQASGWTEKWGGVAVVVAPSVFTNGFFGPVTARSIAVGWSGESEFCSLSVAYLVEVTNDGQTWRSVSQHAPGVIAIVVSDLVPLTRYTVRVSAMTDFGPSDSISGSLATVAGPPLAPQNLAATSVTGTTLTLTWDLPTSDGGSPITDYRVELSSNGGSTWSAIPHTASNSRAYNVTGLIKGRDYQFRVSTITAIGTSTASTPLAVTTLTTNPSAPTTISTRSITTSTATVSWTAPSDNGGSAITDYVVETSRDGTTWSPVPHTASSATSMNLSGLAPGTAYQVRIATKTAVGTSEYLSGSFTTVAGPPLAPQNLAATSVAATTLTLTWDLPTSNGGSPITNYRVEMSSNGGSRWTVIRRGTSNVRSSNVTGLLAGTTYLFRVSTVTARGTSPATGVLAVTTVGDAPPSPTSLAVRSTTATTVTLGWTQPTVVNGSAVRNYIVEYSTDGGSSWIVATKPVSTSRSVTINGFRTRTTYLFRVKAVNDVGESGYSNSITVVTR